MICFISNQSILSVSNTSSQYKSRVLLHSIYRNQSDSTGIYLVKRWYVYIYAGDDLQDSEESEDELESSDLRCIPQDQGQDLTRYADKRSVSERVQPYDVSYKLLFVHCISGFYTRSSPWNSPSSQPSFLIAILGYNYVFVGLIIIIYNLWCLE